MLTISSEISFGYLLHNAIFFGLWVYVTLTLFDNKMVCELECGDILDNSTFLLATYWNLAPTLTLLEIFASKYIWDTTLTF